MHRVTALLAMLLVALGVTSCAGVKRPAKPSAPPPPNATIWEAPTDIRARDLFYGPWGRERAPDPDAVYELDELKHTGVNRGMDVKDPQGREWSVKQPYPGGLDDESQVEVALSRLLSAIGYHQPPVYYLRTFKLKDDFGTRVVTGGRFRLKESALDDQGAWRWEDNPFVGTRPYQGLLVLLMMFNSSDLKPSNNTLYEFKRAGRVEQWYAVRDIGAALGDWHHLAPRKNHPDTFERSPFLLGVSNGYVQFAYNSWYKNLVRDRITPEEVVWASNLLGGLSERQWSDAFRAGGYDERTADRFIRALQARIEEGRRIGTRTATR